MKNSFLVILLILPSFCFSQNLEFEWASDFKGNGRVNIYDFELDSLGNSYYVGDFRGKVDFDLSNDTVFLSTGASSWDDMFILKLDKDEKFKWVKKIGGSGFDKGTAIEIINNSTIFIAGVFQSTIDADPGSGTHYLTSYGSYNSFLSQIDTLGNLVKVNHFKNTVDDLYNRVFLYEMAAIDNDIYFSGSFDGTVDFDPSSQTYPVSASSLARNALDDGFVGRLNINNGLKWAKSLGTPSDYNFIFDPVVDSRGNLLFQFNFRKQTSFHPSSQLNSFVPKGASFAIEKVDSNGNFIWAKAIVAIDSNSACGSSTMIIDDNDNIYTQGSYVGTIDCNPDINKIDSISSDDTLTNSFIIKLNTNGEFINSYTAKLGYLKDSPSIWLRTMTLKTDNIFLGGEFNGSIILSDNSDSILSDHLDKDAIILKFDTSLQLIEKNVFGGRNFETVRHIRTNWANKILLSGQFLDSCDFDPSDKEYFLYSNGSRFWESSFISKFTYGTVSIDEYKIESQNVLLYPNPTTEDITIKTSEYIIKVEIYNSLGKLISLQYSNKLQTSKLNRGVYFIKIKTAKNEYSQSFIKI